MKKVSRNCFLLALGSNATEDPQSNVRILSDALERFNQAVLTIECVSGFWRTPAYPPGAGPDFANACAVVSGALEPAEVLAILHGIEADMGRIRVQRWGQRVIDLDLLAAGDLVAPDAATFRHWLDLPVDAQQTEAPTQLILPHPRMQDRAFVLVPLAEIAAQWRHPVLHQTVAQMLARLDPGETAAMQRIDAKI